VTDPRVQVLWFGRAPESDVVTEMRQRDLVVEHCNGSEAAADLCGGRAAIFWCDSSSLETVLQAAERLTSDLVDYGILVRIIADSDSIALAIQHRLADSLTMKDVFVRTRPLPFAIAEEAARHDPGPKATLDLDIQVAGCGTPVVHSDRILLQRAFHYCSKITLVEFGAGKSEARVFAVHLTDVRSNAGLRPQPAFAKLDQRDKIEREFDNYREYADRFIPFELRPNIHGRIDGAKRSLLVGNLVDRSESLWDIAQRNVAGQAIHSLVDETLAGWRDQAYAVDSIKGSVADELVKLGICRPEEVREFYVDVARQRGVDARPDELWATLRGLDQSFRIAPAHGDLHGENVRVRNGRAIVIDMASVVPRAPLTTDLAALETALAFQMPEDQAELFDDGDWSEEIDRLYQPTTFVHPPGPSEATSVYCWMATVVRQLRRMGIAAQSCPNEYQSAVAAHLLRRCQWDDGPPGDRGRRTKAYLVAAMLTMHLALGAKA
jgi:hypothetical protein